jgi:phosphatidylglycerophosphate synthase
MHDRRPVPGRKWKITDFFVDVLISMKITPNIASLIGMFLGILSGIVFVFTNKIQNIAWITGAILVFLRSAFNIFDGMIAEKTGRSTKWGGFVNEFTDRIADIAMFVGFGYASYSSPLWGYLSTIGALVVSNIRLTGKAYGTNMYYGGIMSKPVRMYVIILCSILMSVHPFKNLPYYTLVFIFTGLIITALQRIWWVKKILS